MISLSSLRHFPDASVAVIACDAGAASHMAAWLAPFHAQLRLCLTGPAKQFFNTCLQSANKPYQTLEQAIEGAQVLISGTSSASNLEHLARKLARLRGIPSVAVLDHWVNYRERFHRHGEEVLPDALWVSDDEAYALAKAMFPNLPLLQLPNHWINGLSNTVRELRSTEHFFCNPRQPARRLLYLLEPIGLSWPLPPATFSTFPSPDGEFQGLHYFFQQIPRLVHQGWVSPLDQLDGIALRPHPSEPAGKYDALIADLASVWPIHLDPEPDLAGSLAWADAAFGCETQALVAAIYCDLPAFSTVPPWAPPCRLPQASLNHLSSLTSS